MDFWSGMLKCVSVCVRTYVFACVYTSFSSKAHGQCDNVFNLHCLTRHNVLNPSALGRKY